MTTIYAYEITNTLGERELIYADRVTAYDLARPHIALSRAPALAAEAVAIPSVDDVFALLQRAVKEIPATLATELWKVTPLQIAWVVGMLRKTAAPPAPAATRASDHIADATEMVGQRELTDSEKRELARVDHEWADCGEADVAYSVLMDWAAHGYLECDRFRLTEKGRQAIASIDPLSTLGANHAE